MSNQLSEDRRVYQDIAAELTEMIRSGELKEGSLLPSERELAHRFRASRASVREALLLLQANGNISMRQRARARVTLLNNPAFLEQLSGAAQVLLAKPNGIADFLEARRLFECGLARHAARHASPKDLERLALALAENKRAVGDPARFSKTDFDFHAVLAEIPRNPIFAALNGALSAWLTEQRTIAVETAVRGAIRHAFEGHRQIYDAIAAHDAERADSAMSEHLKTVSEFYWKAKAIQSKS